MGAECSFWGAIVKIVETLTAGTSPGCFLTEPRKMEEKEES